jgi:FtsH-binding integral membrane protein
MFDPWKNEGSPLFATGLNNGQSVLNSNANVRLGFLRKVYGILSVQLGFTALISVFIMMSPIIEAFIIRK